MTKDEQIKMEKSKVNLTDEEMDELVKNNSKNFFPLNINSKEQNKL